MRHAILLATAALLAQLGPSAVQAEPIIKTHGISVFGEPDLPADYAQLNYVNPDAPKGGEISLAGQGGFDSYNPYTHRGRATEISVIMLERLMEPVADEQDAAYCLLCETLEYPESRDWVIFNLRPEARFSDGSPLTAHDVLFSFELLRDKGLSSYRTGIAQMVEKAEALDDHRIKFYFKSDYPRRDVIRQVGGQIVFSRADFEENNRDIEQSSAIPFLGSGPYVFENADMGRRITVRRDPDYWGRDLPINQGRHNFDRIRYEFFADYDSAFEAFKAGVYTFRTEVSSIHWATRYNFPAVENGTVIKETLPDGRIATGQAWVFNLRREKFQDIRVREAISLMFNFEWSNETLFYGFNTRLNSFWDNSDLAASGTPSAAELALLEPLAGDLPETILTEPAVVQPVSTASGGLDRANLRRAARLLDEAGWQTGTDGMRRNDKGELLQVEFMNANQSLDRVINPFVQNLRALGVDAVNARVDSTELTTRTRSHDYDIVTDFLGQGFYISGGAQQYFGSENVNDVFNSMGLANPAIDKLIRKGIDATTETEMRDIIHATDRALRSLRFWIPQWYRNEYSLAYFDMYGHPDIIPPYDLGVLDFWWHDADKAAELRASGALR